MIVTDDDALAARCRSLRNLCFRPPRRFAHEELGWNLRMTNLQAALGIAQLEPRFMARWVPLAYVLGVMLLVVTDVMGHNAMGATRWINIPGVIRFQPSEFMKILMPATIAWYLSKRTLPPQLKHVAISLMLIGVDLEKDEGRLHAAYNDSEGVTDKFNLKTSGLSG